MLRWLNNKKKSFKKAGTILLFLFLNLIICNNQIYSQDYSKFLYELVKQNAAENKIEDKILMISFWDPENYQSRLMNKEMKRVWHIFQRAKMKNAESGAVLVLISLNSNIAFQNMAIRKDTILNDYLVKFEMNKQDSIYERLKIKNMFFTVFLNGKGDLIARDLTKERIATFMQEQLIRK